MSWRLQLFPESHRALIRYCSPGVNSNFAIEAIVYALTFSTNASIASGGLLNTGTPVIS